MLFVLFVRGGLGVSTLRAEASIGNHQHKRHRFGGKALRGHDSSRRHRPRGSNRRSASRRSAGLITATATAFLAELHSSSRPGAPSARAELVSTAANLGGLGFGALLAGFLAEYTAAPLWLPYLVALSIAPDGARGETLAGLFVAAYLGLTVPVVGLGIATQLVTTRAAILGFAAVLIAVVAVVAAVSRTQGALRA